MVTWQRLAASSYQTPISILLTRSRLVSHGKGYQQSLRRALVTRLSYLDHYCYRDRPTSYNVLYKCPRLQRQPGQSQVSSAAAAHHPPRRESPKRSCEKYRMHLKTFKQRTQVSWPLEQDPKQFAYVASHDCRSRFGPCAGFVELVRRSLQNSPTAESGSQ